MIESNTRKLFNPIQLTGGLALLLLASLATAADKKPAPAPSHPAAAPKSAPAAHSGGGSPAAAGRGPSTGGAHGPTTGGAAHGPTTGGAAHGPTTGGAAHGPTTGGAHGPTTGSPGAHGPAGAGAGRGPSTAGHGPVGGGGRGPSAAGGHGPVGAGNHGPGGAPRGAGNRPMGRDNHVVSTRGGNRMVTRPNGSRAEIHDSRRGMDVHHGLNGNRRVAVERADHSRIVAERGGRGYVQRPYAFRGREYAHRTYYVNGRAYDRFYQRHFYAGVYMDVYAPRFYYAPAFYGWAYNPWVTPVPYAWGWAGNPWAAYYGYYFTPYPVYPSASVWLTDYLISTSLAAAYQARMDAAAAAAANAGPPAGAVALTPEVKNLIAAEVQRQIALENAERQTPADTAGPDPKSSGIERMMTDGVSHIFLAGKDIDVVDGGGMECSLSEGDAIQLSRAPAAGESAASLFVLSSKGGQECRRGAAISVAVVDLQDMQNHMRETIDAGMGEIQSKQAKGLPPIPAPAAAAPTTAAFAAQAPPPDANAAAEINAQWKEADKAEQEVAQEAASGPSAGGDSAPPPPAAAPAQIGLGQTIEEVRSAYGEPKSIVDLGQKKLYVYKDLKVTFINGKVTDVQ